MSRPARSPRSVFPSTRWRTRSKVPVSVKSVEHMDHLRGSDAGGDPRSAPSGASTCSMASPNATPGRAWSGPGASVVRRRDGYLPVECFREGTSGGNFREGGAAAWRHSVWGDFRRVTSVGSGGEDPPLRTRFVEDPGPFASTHLCCFTPLRPSNTALSCSAPQPVHGNCRALSASTPCSAARLWDARRTDARIADGSSQRHRVLGRKEIAFQSVRVVRAPNAPLAAVPRRHCAASPS